MDMARPSRRRSGDGRRPTGPPTGPPAGRVAGKRHRRIASLAAGLVAGRRRPLPRHPLAAQPGLELGVADVDAFEKFPGTGQGRRRPRPIGIERDMVPGRDQHPGAALQVAADLAERLAQAGGALLVAAIAPQLVLKPQARPLPARAERQQRQKRAGLGAARRQVAPVAGLQPEGAVQVDAHCRTVIRHRHRDRPQANRPRPRGRLRPCRRHPHTLAADPARAPFPWVSLA